MGKILMRGIALSFSFLCVMIMIMSQGCKPIQIGQPGDASGSVASVSKSGEITEDEAWSGIIVVEGDVIVPKGISLTIDKGTKVKFTKGRKLVVDGSLYVEGQINKSISLTSAEPEPKPGDWDGVIFGESSPQAKLQYCVIDFHTRILCESDSMQLSDSVIAEGSVAGIICASSSPIIEDNMITKNALGIRCESSASPNINHNAITANLTDGIECKTSAFPTISYNIISNNRKDGISCYSASSPEITFNNILYNGGWAVYGGGKLTSNFIQGNKERGMEAIDTNQSLSSEQYYGAESIDSPRSSRVSEAGVRKEERW